MARIHMPESECASSPEAGVKSAGRRCALTLSGGFVIQLVWLLVP